MPIAQYAVVELLLEKSTDKASRAAILLEKARLMWTTKSDDHLRYYLPFSLLPNMYILFNLY